LHLSFARCFFFYLSFLFPPVEPGVFNCCETIKTDESVGFTGFSLANDSNFDRNPSRGCNFGSGGAVLDLRGCIFVLRGCSSLPKEEKRLHGIMC